MSTVCWFTFCCCDKPDRKQPRGERVYFISLIAIYHLGCQGWRHGRRGRTWCRDHGGARLTDLLSGSQWASFLTHLKPSCPGKTPPTVVGPSNINSHLWKSSTDRFMSQFDQGSSVEVPLPRWPWVMSSWQPRSTTTDNLSGINLESLFMLANIWLEKQIRERHRERELWRLISRNWFRWLRVWLGELKTQWGSWQDELKLQAVGESSDYMIELRLHDRDMTTW